MKKMGVILLLAAVLHAGPIAGGLPRDVSDDLGSIQVGYAVVTPTFGSATDLQVSQTFGFMDEYALLQSGAAAPQMTTSALFFVSISDRFARNLGLAITNPGDTEVRVIMTLRRNDGITVGSQTIFIPPHWQISQLLTQLFSALSVLPKELTGTLSISTTSPVAIIGMRFRGVGFSMETPDQLSAASALPEIFPGIGGSGAFLLPNFVQGGGWATEIILKNTGSSDLTARLDLFTLRGDPLMAKLNGISRSSFFNLRVRAGGVLVLAPLDSNGNSQF